MPKSDGQVFACRDDALQKANIKIQVAMINLRKNACLNEIRKVGVIHDHARSGINRALDADGQTVIVPMEIWAEANPKSRTILSICCARHFKAKGGAKLNLMADAGDVHGNRL